MPFAVRRDITGMRSDRLVAVSYYGKDRLRQAIWNCRCDCGNECQVRMRDVVNNHIKSCGCLHREFHLTHGLHGTPEYQAFHDAKRRCTNKNLKSWNRYGGRGIQFLFTSVDEITNEIGLRPGKGYSIDRINNDGNYEPRNIRWATAKQQANNKSRALKEKV